MQVGDLVLGGAELLQNTHILASAPDGVDWDLELDFAADQEGELGKRKFVRRESALDGARAASLDGFLDGL